MGASFRNLGQIEQLAGCDRLTISPDLIDKLAADTGKLERKLAPGHAGEARLSLNESQFRWLSNEDADGDREAGRRYSSVRAGSGEARGVVAGQAVI